MWLCPSYHLVGASPLLLDVGYSFWWDLTFSCPWLFSNHLWFWCSCKRTWVCVLLLHHIRLSLECTHLFKLEFSPDICPGVRLQDHMVGLLSVFTVALPICIPINIPQGFLFCYTLSSIYYLWTFDNGHFDWCDVIPHCSFNLHFLNN